VPQGPPERPGWQVRISWAVPGPDGAAVEAAVPAGGGVWVGDRWVLTCAHVLGPDPRTVMVRFSFAGGEPVPATVAPHGWLAEQDGDLALLELDRDPPPAARPAPLRPARAVTGHACAAYGYPAGLDGGVFSEPEITGQTPDRLQLTAQDSHGHQIERGFSGTGLFDTETSAVVGLVVTRDRGKDVRGGFAIPLQTMVAAFPQLGPWAGWRLGTDRFLRQHWRPRARGVSQDTTPGWYFTGRTALLRELTGWLEDGPPGRAVRVVTGPAGTGKSAVLAWLCAVSDPQLRAEITTALPDSLADTAAVPAAGRVSAAVWARGMDARDAAGALAAALMLPVAAGAPVEDVLAAAGDLDPAERGGLVVVLDALDEARAPRDIARQLLVPLARDLGVKVLAGTRPGRDEELLASFGERAVIYRLDDPAWFDRHDLADYAAACLRADFDPDLASGYRTAPGACEQVAAAIAEAAGSNFLVAGLAARTRADEPVIDVSVPGWRARQRFPAEVGQAFDDYLARFGDDETRARDLLRAVAYAEGPGLPAGDLWAGMATALAAPRRYSTDDVAWLLDSAAGYLVDSGGENGKPTYRIFHQALIEHLRPEGKETQRQRDLVGALMRTVPPGTAGPDWGGAPPYIRRHLAAHAAAAGLLDDLLEDPLYLLAVDPPRLVPYLDTARSGPGRAAAAVYRQSAHILTSLDRSMRASQLELTAHELGCRSLAAGIAGAAPDRPWQTSWSHGRRAVGHQVITGHTGHTGFNRVCAAVGALPDGTPVIVSGGDDRTVRVWRLADGAPVGEPITGHDGMVTAVAVGALPPDGTPVIVSGGDDRTVRVWRLADGAPVGEPLRGHTSAVGSVAVGALPDGTPIIVSGGADGDNTVRVWRLADGAPVGEPLRGHDSAVGSVAVGALPDGTPVIVTGGMGGTAWVWRIADDTPAGEPLRGHTSAVDAVAVGTLPDGTAVIVTGGRDGTVRVWRLDDRAPMGTPLRGHTSWVGALAVRALPDGTPVIVAGDGDGTVRVWRLDDRAPVGEPLRGHASWVNTVAVGALPDGTPAIVSGGRDRTVRVWRLDDRASVGEPLLGHDGQVKTVAVGALLDGTAVIVSFSRSSSSSRDRTVRVWRLADGTPVGEPLRGPTSWVIAVAVGALPDGTPVIVTGSMAGTVWVWRLADDTSAGEPLRGHDSAVDAVAVGALPDGTAVIVAGGRDGTVRVWRLDDRASVGEPLRGHDSAVGSVAVGALPDGTPVIVAGGRDGTVRVWRLDDRASVGEPLRGHDGQVEAVAVGALPDGTPAIVAGGRDGTVRVWGLGDNTVVIPPLNLAESVRDVAVHSSVIVTAAGTDIAVHQPTFPRPIR
jgi:WD40 repeat protein